MPLPARGRPKHRSCVRRPCKYQGLPRTRCPCQKGIVRSNAVSAPGGAMVILRFKIRSKPDRSDELMAALAEIVTPARATEGVAEFDIARVLRDPDYFIATAIYEDGAALERQESLPQVHRVMAMLPESLAAPPERTIFDVDLDPTLV